MRGYLEQCGFDVHDWGAGVNTGPDGPLERWLQPLAEAVVRLHALGGRRASLVGWSLGGVYAREIAKQCPQAVRQVITLATPFGALGDDNHVGTVFRWLGGGTPQLTVAMQDQLRRRPPVPTTSIYSESDGVVCWRGCMERRAADVENVTVHASHLGMASHPEVLRIVADRLAQAEGQWRRYRAGRRRA